MKLQPAIKRDTARVKGNGEIFTPLALVDEILSKFPDEQWMPGKTFLDPACGDGNFLVRIIYWKVETFSTIGQALRDTYGVEIMADNVARCKERLYLLAMEYDKTIKTLPAAKKKWGKYVEKNIVCADALTFDFNTLPDHLFDGEPAD